MYRLAACLDLTFRQGGGGVGLDEVWDVVTGQLGALDHVSHWIDANPRPRQRRLPGDLGVIGEHLTSMWPALCEAPFGSALTLRVFDLPHPPREQLTLTIPTPSDRRDWSNLIVARRPSWVMDDPEAVVEGMLELATRLRPHHATAGLSLMSEPWMERSYFASAFPHLEAHPGLTVPYQLRWGADGAGIASIGWLTVLGDEPLRLVGGAGGLERSLADAAERCGVAPPELIRFDGGVLVRAGNRPDPGERGAAPASYRAADAALRPLRWDGVSDHPNHWLRTAPEKDRKETTRRWMARFE